MSNRGLTMLAALNEGRGQPPQMIRTLKLDIWAGRMDSFGEGFLNVHWDVDPAYANPDGSIYGGWIAAMADNLLYLVSTTVMKEAEDASTSDLQLIFMRPVKEGRIRIETRVTERSRSTILCDCSFFLPDGRLAARATAQQSVYERKMLPPA
jgi:uncharacterized protein (TIGR00369 family)